MLFTPSTSPSGVSATEGDSSISTYASTTPTVGISLPTSISFDDVLPTTTGATTTASTNLTVTTNDSAGYSLYLYTDEDNSLKPVNPANNSSISATNTASALNDLVNNTWGYSIGTTTAGSDVLYAAVPTDGSTPIQTKDTSTTNSANDTYTLSFAAKVNTDLPSGTYSNTLTLAVVAEPKAITDITGLTYMQDMTPEVCAETEVGTTARLTDKRDNKQYWVTKLADNNCWMTQNLRLSGGRTLTPTNSNVSSSWGFPNNSLKAGDTNYIGSSYNEAGSVINESASGGGYYNYCVASAGTVCNNTEQQDTTQDICPKGWKLPTLDEARGITAYSVAFLPVLNGYYYDGAPYNAGSAGYWWSATANDGKRQYGLYYNDSNNSLSTGSSGKNYGLSVRCISRQD